LSVSSAPLADTDSLSSVDIKTGSNRIFIPSSIKKNYPTKATNKPEVDMRFTIPNARPALTPLGHRLLHLSAFKLANLESPLGTREEGGALWKGVLVREAVKSAWISVEEGFEGDLTDWRGKGAMGLDVIGEEDEDENEGMVMPGKGEERWFEELLGSLGDDEYTSAGNEAAQHEWVESSVSLPVLDDFDYDVEDMEAFTLPPAPTSPPEPPINSPATSTVVLTEDEAAVAIDETRVDVEAVDDCSDCVSTCSDDNVIQVIPTSASREDSARLDWLTMPYLVGYRSPETPLPSPVESIASLELNYDDLDECADDFLLPPPLHRSKSSSSTFSDDQCVTPPAKSCEDFEEELHRAGNLDVRTADSEGGLGLGLYVDDFVCASY